MDWRDLDSAVQVKPAAKIKLTDAMALGEDIFPDKDEAKKQTAKDSEAINGLQDRLFAEGARALLIVLQGMDTAGKDGTVRDVFNDTGPLGVEVTPFGKPTEEELKHDFLWRIHNATPGKGKIGIFNRSHYEDVLVVKVRKLAPAAAIEQRYAQINAFEKQLIENNVVILKFMLHITKDEQKARLEERLEDPVKRWKFNPGDLEDRKLWDQFMRAYETALTRCSTAHAPWRIIPADKKWRRNAIIARIVRGTLEEMNPQPREPSFDPKAFVIE
ncbi:MAG TPA: PPK2 family polyphosphate kinase [Caulobacterales bacterium]|nr:PPK2 family polyphosphate kinase [Caulobacterales bacterium]